MTLPALPSRLSYTMLYQQDITVHAVPVAAVLLADYKKLRECAEAYLDALGRAIEALKDVKWQKDCGCDGPDATGEYSNFPDIERDAMYEIAANYLAALGPLPEIKP